jgi:hypothetical protein
MSEVPAATETPTTQAPEGILVDKVIADVIEKVTESVGKSKAQALAPIITTYGPVFAKMTAAEIWEWIALAVRGDPFKAYAAIVAELGNDDLINEWGAINAKWQTANAANAVSVSWQRDAIAALLKGLVTIAASMVVL